MDEEVCEQYLPNPSIALHPDEVRFCDNVAVAQDKLFVNLSDNVTKCSHVKV